MVRLSPAERRDLADKTSAAGLPALSAGVRAAIAAWRPGPRRLPDSGNELEVVYDP